jgi:hypothetical protein
MFRYKIYINVFKHFKQLDGYVFKMQYILTFVLYSADSIASEGKLKYIFEGHQPQFSHRTAKTINWKQYHISQNIKWPPPFFQWENLGEKFLCQNWIWKLVLMVESKRN